MEDISDGLESRPVPYEPSCSSSGPSYPDNFRYVTRSIPGPGSNRDLFEDQLCGCDCSKGCNVEMCPCLKRFGPNYHPHTAQLTLDAVVSSKMKPVLECNSQCECDASCCNRLVQNGLKVSLKISHSGPKGFGLFACEDIQKLKFVCEYAGEVVSPAEARKRLEKKDGDMNYLIVVREHCLESVVVTCVDPKYIGNAGRFANHSCDPNLLMVPVRVDSSIPRLALFARRNISAGEELTFDYSGETILHCQSFAHGQSAERIKEDKTCNVSESSDVTYLENENDATVMLNNSSEAAGYMSKKNVSDKSRKNGLCIKTGINPCSSSNSILNSSEDMKIQTNSSCVDDEQIQKEVGSTNFKDSDYVLETSMTSFKPTVSRRKRKLSSDEEGMICVTGNEESYSKLELKDNEDAANGLISAAKKPCLCGSCQCKGTLPFDSLILTHEEALSLT